MRNIIWDCFQATGNIDAYLLYKDFEYHTDQHPLESEEELGEGN